MFHVLINSTLHTHIINQSLSVNNPLSHSTMSSIKTVVDIGVNLTNREFKTNWRHVVKRSIDAGVDPLILTGTSISKSRESLRLAKLWLNETSTANLYCTVGVHPHDAKTFSHSTITELEKLIRDNPNLVVAVGECGLDYNRNFSSRDDQIHAFSQQIKLACSLNLALFVHEREAHADLLKVFDQVEAEVSSPLPPVVIHCFTGSLQEARVYLDRGFYIGFTGTICKKQRGAPLRALLPEIPLNRIMTETDAPFMGFKKGRRGSEPADCMDVAQKLAEVLGVPLDTVCEATTKNAADFFGLGRLTKN